MRQLAEELQVSKVSINNRIDKLNLRDELVKAGNRHLIPEATADVIRESFRTNRKTEPPQPDTQAVMLDILSEQLKKTVYLRFSFLDFPGHASYNSLVCTIMAFYVRQG